MYFGNSVVQKTGIDKCLKSAVLQYPSTRNMLNRPKHCPNLNDSTITIFIDHSESNYT